MNKTADRSENCWEIFECRDVNCPVYGQENLECWLSSESHCNQHIQDSWIEKMEVCLNCTVFRKNINERQWEKTFLLIARQFENYRRRMGEEAQKLKKTQKKLQEFKTTSIYFLKELDDSRKELQKERNSLEERVMQKTHEIQQIQNQLIHSARMAAIGRFSAGIAHEINNPLGAIIYYVRSVLAHPEIIGQNKGYLELTLKGLTRIENILRQILSHSGRRESKPVKTAINRLIKETILYLEHLLSDRDIILETDLHENIPQVLIDPSHIQQVLTNILNNAIDAVQNDGKIVIASLVIGNQIQIRVEDNGCGISEEDLEKVFDPFYSTKEVGQGTGLGLFVSYNLIQMYQGEILLQKGKHGGTIVDICLPVNHERKE